jgi:hypothetical protein
MKQTAVEWLIQEYINGAFINIQIMKEALEMEKEQIKNAYLKNHLQGCWMEKSAEEFAEQYYTETFKSE